MKWIGAIIASLIVLNLLATIPASAAVQVTKVEIRGAAASEKAIAGSGLNLSNIANVPVIWTTQNFAGFYYDLKDNLGREELQILQTGLSASQRTIDENNMVYRTTAETKKLKVVKEGFNDSINAAVAAGLERVGDSFTSKGEYLIVGWQGERYVPVNNKIDKLSKLLFEHSIAANEKKTLAAGETWNMGDGWNLTANSIDAKSDPRQVSLTLSKDGVEKDKKIISQGRIYTYVEKNIANESDVPMLVTLVDSVFSGTTGDMVQFRFTWVISPKVTTIKTGDKFGVFEVDNINETARSLVLDNEEIKINLDQNAVVDLVGDIKFKVADKADVLRFYPIETRTNSGMYEVRGVGASEKAIAGSGFNLGNIANVPVIWTTQNFAGFYYDLKDNLGREELQILQTDLSASQRTINENNMVYRTTAETKKLKVVKEGFNDSINAAVAAGLERVGDSFTSKGEYLIVGWQGERYIPVNNKIDKLSKLLFEHSIAANEKKTLAAGETWNMGDGWNLTANSIDAKSDPRQVSLTLSKDGVEKDKKIISQGRIYTYVEKNIADESDVPMLVTLVDSVFSGTTGDMAQFRFTWVISPKVIIIKNGDVFGVFKVTGINQTGRRLELKNEEVTVNLDQNAVVDLIGDIKFRLADKADVLRLYPKIDYKIPETSSNSTAIPSQTSALNSTPAVKSQETPAASTPAQTAQAVTTPKPPSTAQTATSASMKAPGLEAILAIAGLLALAYLVLRK